MNNSKYVWLLGLVVTLAIIITPIILFVPDKAPKRDDPWAHVPPAKVHTDHTPLMQGPYETGSDVTKACLDCHPTAVQEVMQTTHWTWESEPVYDPDHGKYVTLGKKNAINNFCISIESNWPACTACHTGYGWTDESFDFSNEENVDCLVCHDNSGTYKKSKGGYPADDVDLVAVAQSVASPTRENCGGCHFKGGGGNAVKHGDLDESLYFPTARIDVHMGGYDFQCITCHQTQNHKVKGHAPSVSVGILNTENQVHCIDCHSEQPHDDPRLNEHTDTVACQTCHIPTMAKKEATKIHWDWSTAGQDLPEDPHQYLKIKGTFAYEKNLPPEYYWYNGTVSRYLKGDLIDPSRPTPMNAPNGDINDPNAKIWPFKVHRGKQIYDTVYGYFLVPKTFGEGGYWTEFDWDKAARLGSEASGLKYSGHYDFAPTEFYWPTTHMVSPKEDALQCVDCHSENGRLDWIALGYEGDPVKVGGRELTPAISKKTR
ncbi:MAG: tetrathionate reductase family octaheme c-type cytochrome [Chloroflexi bacterium]|nr:MAG: tetrathionate reductase family octaheme c-type cytochrome [Chloroflexota bacterium]